MNTRQTVVCWAAVLLLACAADAQVFIDFDDLPSGTPLTNQYPNATFSSSSESSNFVYAFSPAPSEPNIVCTGSSGGGITCSQPTYVDFTPAVNGLTFQAVQVNDTGTAGQIVVFEDGVQTAIVDIVGPMVPWGTIDLSAYSNVTRIEIINITDGGGIGWDDFALTPVPVELMSFSIE